MKCSIPFKDRTCIPDHCDSCRFRNFQKIYSIVFIAHNESTIGSTFYKDPKRAIQRAREYVTQEEIRSKLLAEEFNGDPEFINDPIKPKKFVEEKPYDKTIWWMSYGYESIEVKEHEIDERIGE